MNRTQFEEYSDRRRAERAGAFQVECQDEVHFTVNNHPYELVENYLAAFDPTALADRFSPILSKYDYIVGDWGFDQLRLHGFYAKESPLYSPERGEEVIADYLVEECNFGCAYFVIHNLDVQIPRALTKPKRTRRRPKAHREGNRRRSHRSRNQKNHRRNG